jgi:hypothetical protein
MHSLRNLASEIDNVVFNLKQTWTAMHNLVSEIDAVVHNLEETWTAISITHENFQRDNANG